MGWRPIETVPKDGTVIELLGSNGKLDIGKWCEYGTPFGKNDFGIPEDQTGELSTEYGEGPYTHWRPLAPNAEFRPQDEAQLRTVEPGTPC